MYVVHTDWIRPCWIVGLCVRPSLVGWLLIPPGLATTKKVATTIDWEGQDDDEEGRDDPRRLRRSGIRGKIPSQSLA